MADMTDLNDLPDKALRAMIEAGRLTDEQCADRALVALEIVALAEERLSALDLVTHVTPIAPKTRYNGGERITDDDDARDHPKDE